MKSNSRLQDSKEFPFHPSLFTWLAFSMTSWIFRWRCFSMSLLADRCIFVRIFEENLFHFLCSGRRALFTHFTGFCVTSCSRLKRTQHERKITAVSFPPYTQIIKKLLNLQLGVSVVRLQKAHMFSLQRMGEIRKSERLKCRSQSISINQEFRQT